MLNTTLGYIEKDGKYLMLHRTKKKNDINHEKWIGIGGKMETGESVLSCMQRECKEETGYDWHDPKLRAIITFNFQKKENDPLFSELMFLFTGHEISGQQKECDEGELVWIPKEEIANLPLWEGDHLFFEQLEKDQELFYMRLDYIGDRLIFASYNEKTILKKEGKEKNMNESQQFIQLIERLIECDPIEAIGLGGSRATNLADAHSDYDLYIYLNQDLPLAEREQVFEGLFQIIEYDNQFWEREDDGIFLDGIPIDILYRNIEDFDKALETTLLDHQAQNAYTTCLWNNLKNTKILFDRHGKLKKLQTKYNISYPIQLKENIIQRHRALLFDGLPNYADQLKKALLRNDMPAINHRAAAFAETYFDLLFALNETSHPGEKRMMNETQKLENVPEHFVEDLTSLFQHLFIDPNQAIKDLEQLKTQMKKLLNE
ncbi:NUDIX domain-containing protein [Dubosiella newyorkensis]|uniref:NUDIX domain-containing protein n=1 Tax=Dubosiella newyorkensis TaxID=1862672 RepID=UPI00248AB9EB|nr:NUDIX domain-containing protein [Dubosiella newyorkensis]